MPFVFALVWQSELITCQESSVLPSSINRISKDKPSDFNALRIQLWSSGRDSASFNKGMMIVKSIVAMRLQTYKITPYSGRLRLRINPVIIEIINPINNPPISPNAAIIPGEMNLLCISSI